VTATDPQIVQRDAQPSAAVRVKQPMAELDLAALFDTYLPVVAGRLTELGAAPAGPPFGRYHAFGQDVADVEIGWPVAGPVDALRPLSDAEPGEVASSELPAGPVAVAVHRGPYDTLGEAYRRLEAWVPEQGRTLGAAPWESYVDNPVEVDASELRTEICWPLA
jgi:effector-binding domain-containing protein